jgi:ParB-like chromosome segregation protein Spo0J
MSPVHSTEVVPVQNEVAAEAVSRANALIEQAYEILNNEVFSAPMPVGKVLWIHISKVQANDYNPNSVAGQEMKLLHTSISEDGYTQPVVTIYDPEAGPDRSGRYIIVDGFHRYTVMRNNADIQGQTNAYLPVVVIDKPIADRIASTVRHNRARGKHSVAGMSSLVYQMLQAGDDDVTICNKLGMEPQELARLKHITGYSKLYKDVEKYSDVVLTRAQLEGKAEYKKEHEDEQLPRF